METIKNPYAILDEQADLDIPTASLQIYDAIAKDLTRPKDTHVNRASSATLCPRRRWYQRTGCEGKQLTPRKIINFLLGDLSEKAVLYYVRTGLVGEGKLYSEVDLGTKLGEFTFSGKKIEVYDQMTLTWKIQGGPDITAHADGFGKRHDGTWELIEVKSAANYGFQNFKTEGAGDYLKQSHAVMNTDECKARNIKSVRFFYLRKETGHIWDGLFHYDQMLSNVVEQEFKAVMLPVIPEDLYPLEIKKGCLQPVWQCQYCPFIESCKGKWEIEFEFSKFSGSHKPIYKRKIS